MQPSCRLLYACFSKGAPDEAKAHRDRLTWQEPVDFGDSAEYCWDCGLHALLIMIDDFLGSFSDILSITHETDMIIPGNPSFSPISSPKTLWELTFLKFLVWGCRLSLQTPGAVLIQCWQIAPISVTVFERVCYS